MKQQHTSLFQLCFLLLIVFKIASVGNVTAPYWLLILGYVVVRVTNAILSEGASKKLAEWWYIAKTKRQVEKLDKQSKELIEKVKKELQER